jgi:S-formylglutathione hydrolase FrmB
MKRLAVTALAAMLTLGAVAQQKSKPAPKPVQKTVSKPAPAVANNPVVQDREFQSHSLGRVTHYRVILPISYAQSARNYPALYLLHGLYGDYKNWTTLTDLIDYAAKYDLIIVMPDAENSWYVNSATVPMNRYEDFIIKDMIPEAEKSFRIIRSAHRRAIAGLSMGGYGALKFALKNPGEFVVAASMSGALNAATDIGQVLPDIMKDVTPAFGPPGTETRALNDLYALAEKADPANTAYFYLDCGTSDALLNANRKFVAILSGRKFRYEYHEVPGDHSWEYWDRRIPFVLEVVAEMVTKP